MRARQSPQKARQSPQEANDGQTKPPSGQTKAPKRPDKAPRVSVLTLPRPPGAQSSQPSPAPHVNCVLLTKQGPALSACPLPPPPLPLCRPSSETECPSIARTVPFTNLMAFSACARVMNAANAKPRSLPSVPRGSVSSHTNPACCSAARTLASVACSTTSTGTARGVCWKGWGTGAQHGVHTYTVASVA